MKKTMRCEKGECQKASVAPVTFTARDPQKGAHTDFAIFLCDEHAQEAKTFNEADLSGLAAWLNTRSPNSKS